MRKKWLQLALLVLCSVGSMMAQRESKKIDVEKSVINWKGTRIVGAPHYGTILFKEGVVEFVNGILVGGSFLVDMESIDVTDLKNKSKEILEKHLKNEDFFGVDIHPVSALNFTSIERKNKGEYHIEGDLTIKNITQPVSFVLIAEEGSFKADVVFDRTLYGIKYNSGKFFKGLGNAAIKDNVELKVEVVY